MVGIIRQIRLYIQRYLRTQKRASHQSWNAETWIFQWNAAQSVRYIYAANHTSTYTIQIRTEINGYIKGMQTTTIKTTSDYRETCTLTTARNPNGCPLTVGHPLSLGVSGSLTKNKELLIVLIHSEKKFFWLGPISPVHSRTIVYSCEVVITYSNRLTQTSIKSFYKIERSSAQSTWVCWITAAVGVTANL